jgi:hypothetical protein
MAMDPTALFNQKKIGEALRQKRETSPIMYVVRGAHIECDYGDGERQIDMPRSHGAYVNEFPLMHDTDNVPIENIPSFGICNKTRTGCALDIIGPWKSVAENVYMKGGRVLTTDSYLVCLTGGGIIRFTDSGQDQESDSQVIIEPETVQPPVPEEPPLTHWIPDEPLRIDDDNMLTRKLIKLGVTQEKIDDVWEASRSYYSAYGVELDPRFALSIIAQEGTGSFNTSSINRAADGQHGFEKDWALDLVKANDVLFGKMLGYMAYGNEFNSAVAGTDSPGIGDEGNFSKYANWNTTIVSVKNGKVRNGTYAGHGKWNEGITSFYESVAGPGQMQAYSDYITAFGKEKVHEIAPSIDLPDTNFAECQNAQDSRGELNGEYTIIAE